MRRGFTLIELLVVIAIISILASILFPVFSRARSKARGTVCQSNIRQMALAIRMYADDANEMLPRWSLAGGSPTSPPPAGHPYTWDEQVFPYYRNKNMLYCPENPFGLGLRSYAFPRYVSGVPTGRIPNPVATVVLFEKGKYESGIWQDATGENVRQSHTSQGQPGYSELPFHNDGKNFAFIDGHVKWYNVSAGPFAAVGRPGAAPGACEVPGAAPDGDWPPAG